MCLQAMRTHCQGDCPAVVREVMTVNTIIIAEIGENHYGRWDICRGMVEEAAANGATVIKFQTYTADQFGRDHQWYDDFKRVEMPESVHFEMQTLCRELGVEFLSSTFTIRSTAFLVDRMGCDALKLASRAEEEAAQLPPLIAETAAAVPTRIGCGDAHAALMEAADLHRSTVEEADSVRARGSKITASIELMHQTQEASAATTHAEVNEAPTPP